nr:hypothetical protein Iba_chr05aCG9840 [Ipomoea batatas]
MVELRPCVSSVLPDTARSVSDCAGSGALSSARPFVRKTCVRAVPRKQHPLNCWENRNLPLSALDTGQPTFLEAIDPKEQRAHSQPEGKIPKQMGKLRGRGWQNLSKACGGVGHTQQALRTRQTQTWVRAAMRSRPASDLAKPPGDKDPPCAGGERSLNILLKMASDSL